MIVGRVFFRAGVLRIYATVRGALLQRVYYGYTRAQALAEFREERRALTPHKEHSRAKADDRRRDAARA